jgi:hypothetical protein
MSSVAGSYFSVGRKQRFCRQVSVASCEFPDVWRLLILFSGMWHRFFANSDFFRTDVNSRSNEAKAVIFCEIFDKVSWNVQTVV